MSETAVKFFIQNYKTENGGIGTLEQEFLTIPFHKDPDINNPRVKNEIGKAGSFEFSMEPTSALYNAMIQMKTMMRVVLFGKTIFRGRVLTIDQSPLTGSHTIHCEGDLSFFLDSYQQGVKDDIRPTISVFNYLTQIINQHNQCVDASRQFALGEVPGQYTAATAESQRVIIPAEKANQKFGDASWNTSMDRLEGLLGDFGGYFRTRHDAENHITYLDWYDKYYNATTNTQPIKLARNLIDLSGPAEISNLFTVIIPIGRNQSEDVFISDYWPVVNTNHEKVPWIGVRELVTESLYTETELNADFHRAADYANANSQYGQIWKIINFPNANTPEKLFTYAKDWIKNNYMPSNTQWDVSALDMRFMNGNDQGLYCGDRIVLDAPEVDQTYSGMSIISAEYDLFNPDKNKYTIGYPNPETNASYGVPEKTARTTGHSSSTKKGGSGGKNPPGGGDDSPSSQDLEAMKSNFIAQYVNKVNLKNDIPYDNPLAFCRFDEYGEELDEDTAKKKAMDTATKLANTKAMLRAELEYEAKQRGCAWDDPQLLIDFTPELKREQAEYRQKNVYHMVHDLGIDEGAANTIMYDSAGQSLLASLVDDNGNWTQKAYDLNIPNEMGAAEVKERAIRTRKELNGESTSSISSIVNSPVDWLGSLGINVSNFFNVDDNSDDEDSILNAFFGRNDTGDGDHTGSVMAITDIKNKLSGTREKITNWFNGLFKGSEKDTETSDGTGTWVQKGWDFLNGVFSGENRESGGSKFNLNSDSTEIDGDTGSAGFRTVDSSGNPVGETTLGGWQVTLNKPYRYTAQIEVDGNIETHEFVVPDHTIAVDDIHFTKKYDSLRAVLAVVDVLLADYAHINSLEALQAQIGGVYIDLEHLTYSFNDEVHDLVAELEDTASRHKRTLQDTANDLTNELIDTASQHKQTLTDEKNGLVNELISTASQHKQTLTDTKNELVNELEDTASQHKQTLTDEKNGLVNELISTASQHKQTLTDEKNGLVNELISTASQHKQTLADTTNGLIHTIEDSASQHRESLEDATTSFKNEIISTASSELRRITNATTGLESRLEQTENTISAIVEGTGSTASVKPAQIVAAITDENGVLSSSIKLSADKIFMDGTTTINDIFQVAASYVSVAKPIYVSNNESATIINPTNIRTDAIYAGTNRILMKVADVQPSTTNPNQLIISYYDGTSKTFSKATTLRSGGWSGSGHVFTVEATPQGNTYTIGLDNGTGSNTNLVTGVGDLSVSFTGSTPYLSIPITVTQVYSGEGDDDDLRYTRTPIVKNVGDLLENLTGTKKITQNGTISLTSLPSGKMGYGNIEIDVATSSITGLAVDTTNHQVKTSTSETAQSVTISPGTMTRTYVTAQKRFVYVLPINATIGTTSSVIATASGTIDATASYNAGKEDATLTVNGWTSGHLKVSNTDKSDTNVDIQLSNMALTENSLTWTNNTGSGSQPIRASMSTNNGSASTVSTGATIQISISINSLLQRSKITIPINSSPWENGARSFSVKTTMSHPDPSAEVYVNLTSGTAVRSGDYFTVSILDGTTDTGLGILVDTTPYTGTKPITQNGSFSASSDGYIGYKSVTVNVPVKLNTSYTPAGSSTPINAVVPSTDGTGDPYLRVYGVVGNLTSTDADGERDIDIKVGADTVETITVTDYGDGYTAGRNSVTPKVRYTAAMPYDGDTIKAVIAGTTGSDFLQVISVDYGLTGSGTANGSREILFQIGSNEIYHQTLTDYGDGFTAGRNSITPKVSYQAAMPYDGDTIKAVVAGTTGSDFLQVVSVDYGLTGSGTANGSREILFKIGNNELYHQTLTDYGDGYTAGRNSVTPVTPKVRYSAAMPYDGDTIKAVIAGTTGSDFLQVISVDYGLTGSGANRSREILFKIGDTEIYHQTLTDYGSGYTAGWNGCFATKSLSAPESKTLDPNEVIYINAYLTNSSGTQTNFGYRWYSAPTTWLNIKTSGTGWNSQLCGTLPYAGGPNGDYVHIVNENKNNATVYNGSTPTLPAIWKLPADRYQDGYDAGYAAGSGSGPTYTQVGMSVSQRSTTSSGKYMYKLTYGPVSTFKNEGDTWNFWVRN